MNLQALLRAEPRFHEDASGQPYSWQVSKYVLSFLDTHVREGFRTLEVGAGVSTVLFALKGATHVCVVPADEEVSRIKMFCREHAISLDRLTFEVDRSERCLPQLDVTDLDLVLIDGAHGFPMPFLDWYYTADRLKVGGLLIIDDTHIWTGHILKMFLMQEPEWKLEVDFPPRSVVFMKVREGSREKNESDQAYVLQGTVDLMFRTYPLYVDWIRSFAPRDLFLQKERSLAFRAFRARYVARKIISRVVPEPVKRGFHALLSKF